MDRSLLKYPKKSHRKSIRFPRNSVLLAEFMGIEFGDGGIGNSWQIVVTLNAVKDSEYAKYVTNLISKLFRVDVAVRKKKTTNALQIVISSTSIVDFITQRGAVRGNKIKQQIDTPQWIRGIPAYEKAFVRGLMDTDGCLYVHCHRVRDKIYKNIGLCFTSWSPNLLCSVADILCESGIKPHIADRGRRIYLYDEKSVVKYLCVFGSANPRITGLYRKWKHEWVV